MVFTVYVFVQVYFNLGATKFKDYFVTVKVSNLGVIWKEFTGGVHCAHAVYKDSICHGIEVMMNVTQQEDMKKKCPWS